METYRCSVWTLAAAFCVLFTLFCCTNAKFFDDSSMEVGKRYITPSCQRCLYHPGDWISCQTCYGRPGLIPYYGFTKRSHPESDEISQLTSYDNSQYDDSTSLDVEKRATFLTCRCCISLAARKCCDKCSLTPYYGKRSYQEPAAFYGQDGDLGKGECSCCDSEPFNYSCCTSRCSRRKRK